MQLTEGLEIGEENSSCSRLRQVWKLLKGL